MKGKSRNSPVNRLVTSMPSVTGRDFSLGLENAWQLVSKKLPLLDINHFSPYARYLSDSYKGGSNPENKKNWGALLCDEKAGITLLHSFNKLQGMFCSTKELSFYFALLSPCHTEEFFLTNKNFNPGAPQMTLSAGLGPQ